MVEIVLCADLIAVALEHDLGEAFEPLLVGGRVVRGGSCRARWRGTSRSAWWRGLCVSGGRVCEVEEGEAFEVSGAFVVVFVGEEVLAWIPGRHALVAAGF